MLVSGRGWPSDMMPSGDSKLKAFNGWGNSFPVFEIAITWGVHCARVRVSISQLDQYFSVS